MTLLRRYVDRHDGSLVIACALAICAALLAALPTGILAFALYHALHDALRRSQVAVAVTVLAIAVAVRIVVATAAGRRLQRVLSRCAERLRLDVLERLRRLSPRELADIDAGRTVAIVTTGIDETIAILGDAFDVIFGSLVTALLILAILATIDWRIALVSLAFLPLSAGYLWRSRKISSRATPRLVRARSEGASRFFEYIESVSLLRAFGRTAERTRRLSWALRELQIKAFETAIAPIPFGVLTLFFVEFGFTIAVMAGTQFGANASFAGARYVIALAIALAYFQALFDALDAYLRLRDADSNLRELERLLDADLVEGISNVDALRTHDLVVEHVSFSYDRGPVLHDISHRFPIGLTAIVGRSGAGKSALAGVMAGLWKPSDGTVRFGGVDVRTLSHDERTRAVAFVFQDVHLLEDTVANNIAAGRPGASFEEIRAAAHTAECDEFVARLAEGYDSVVRAGGANFSLGERQRIAIARALLSRAPIMIFDECTASLDAAAERAVHRAIEAIADRTTIVLITHRLATVRNARQIVVLAGGAVSEAGTHDVLLERKAEYWTLWSAYERSRRWREAS